ncbi:MAG: hypothetical protein NC929_01115, partial [Candidatus Omnitrophica bacterium]|nr:hypothetical protein [Candidatus Omnitrophota bacterium]
MKIVWIFMVISFLYQVNAEDIIISDVYPPPDGMVGILNPELSVRITHGDNRPIEIIFSSDASGEWQEIGRIKEAGPGVYRIRPRDMTRRGTTYNWEVTVSDGKEELSKRFSFNLAVFVGPKSQVITHSDCWKYGYIKHGWEKGKFFVTTQRGTWAAYDVDKGWYRTYQRLMRREKMTGNWKAMEDGGDLGHPFWGYWNGAYHVLGMRADGFGWQMASAKTFEDFGKLIYEKDLKDTGTRTIQPHWEEGTTYTFSEDRAWIMAIDYDEQTKKGLVKYWEWTKEKGWGAPVIVGIVSNHTGRVALVRHTREIWYIFVTEGEIGALDGQDMSFKSTLKYFKSVDAGKTWSALTDTGVPAHAIWSSVSFARYGDNYYVFLSEGRDTYIYFTRDLEDWKYDHRTRQRVAKGMWCKPNGTLLNQ